MGCVRLQRKCTRQRFLPPPPSCPSPSSCIFQQQNQKKEEKSQTHHDVDVPSSIYSVSSHLYTLAGYRLSVDKYSKKTFHVCKVKTIIAKSNVIDIINIKYQTHIDQIISFRLGCLLNFSSQFRFSVRSTQFARQRAQLSCQTTNNIIKPDTLRLYRQELIIKINKKPKTITNKERRTINTHTTLYHPIFLISESFSNQN